MAKINEIPTRVIFGRDCVKQNAEIFEKFGKTCLIVTGKSSKNNGSLDDVLKVLNKTGQTAVVFDGVTPNPTVECVYSGAEVAKKVKADFIVAIGGGSPMDAAKTIALLAKQDIKKEDVFKGLFAPDALPMIHIPTTAGTGSEVTQYSILTNDEARTKTNVSSPAIFPKVAFLDGKYMSALSRMSTINTALDALSHAIEGMLTFKADEKSDEVALEAIKRLHDMFPKLRSFDLSLSDRDELLYSAMLAGKVIAQAGTTIVHTMGYSLTYFDGYDHGYANGLLLASLLKLCEKKTPQKAQAMERAMGIENADVLFDEITSLYGSRPKFDEDKLKDYALVAASGKKKEACIYKPTYEEIFRMFKESIG